MASSRNVRRTGRSAVAAVRRQLRFEVLGARRVLAAGLGDLGAGSVGGSISGNVWESQPAILSEGVPQNPLAGRLVYLDLNDDGQLDPNEPLQRTGADGRFRFEGLQPGEYVVRLVDATASQRQTLPIAPELESLHVALEGGEQIVANHQGDTAIVVAGESLYRIGLVDGQVQQLELPGAIGGVQWLDDGSLLVLLEAATSGSAALRVADDFLTVEPLDLELGEDESGWSSAALAEGGESGLLVPRTDAATAALRILKLAEGQLIAEHSDFHVDPAARLMSDPGGPLVLVTQPQEDGGGQKLVLWSSATGSPLYGSEAVLSETAEIVAFDAAGGLVVARQADGSIELLDADNRFASLHVLSGWSGPFALDGHRDLLLGMADPATLAVFDVSAGQVIETLPLDLELLGSVASMAVAGSADRLLLLGSRGVAQVRLDRPVGRRIQVDSGGSVAGVDFSVQLLGENERPTFVLPPQYQIDADAPLVVPAPGLLVGVFDADSADRPRIVQLSEPQFGSVVVGHDGRFTYTPSSGFSGIDRFTVVATDGRDASAATEVTIQVTAIPPAVTFNGNSISEQAGAGTVVGTLEIAGSDPADAYSFQLSDPRFLTDGSQVVVAPGAQFHAATEPQIPLGVVAHHVENPEESFEGEFLIDVHPEPGHGDEEEDADETSDHIVLTGDIILERAPGYKIGTLNLPNSMTSVIDWEVDDGRFEVDGSTLRLRDGVSVRSGDQSEVVLTITATVDGEPPESWSTVFVLPVVSNLAPWQNPLNPLDVTGSGEVTPLDALIIINTINRDGPQVLDDIPNTLGPPYLDVNGDGMVTPLDALIIINQLNKQVSEAITDPLPLPTAEGEAAPQSTLPLSLAQSQGTPPETTPGPEPAPAPAAEREDARQRSALVSDDRGRLEPPARPHRHAAAIDAVMNRLASARSLQGASTADVAESGASEPHATRLDGGPFPHLDDPRV